MGYVLIFKPPEDIKPRLLQMGVLNVLIPLTTSDNPEVQGNSAAAIGNLSSRIHDYSAFVQVWESPADGIHGYLTRFLVLTLFVSVLPE